jgi:hypothetical protein
VVERYGFLGGCLIGGATGFHTFYNVYHREAGAAKRKLVEGIAQEIVDRLTAAGGGLGHIEFERSINFNSVLTPVEPEALKRVAHEMLAEAGVDLLLHARAVDVLKEGDRAAGVIIESKAGREAIRARQVVDTSGDGDAAARLGAPHTHYAREKAWGVSLTFRLAAVRLEAALEQLDPMGVVSQVARAVKVGGTGPEIVRMAFSLRRAFPQECERLGLPGHFITTSIRRGECTYCNCTWHRPSDTLDPRDLGRAELALRRQVEAVAAFLRERVRGFEDSYVAATSVQVGVRQSRVFDCEYEVTREDVVGGRQFPDEVGLIAFVDLADYWVKDAGAVGLPYRALVPKGVENLLVAGRMIGHDHVVFQTLRNTVASMLGGQAAGTAAAMAAADGTSPRRLDPQVLRRRLAADGVLFE